MKLVRSLMMLSMSTALTVTGANAADYYVQAPNAGPVAGTALGAVSLQGKKKTSDSEGTLTEKSLRVRIRQLGGSRAGKWLSTRDAEETTERDSGETATVSTFITPDPVSAESTEPVETATDDGPVQDELTDEELAEAEAAVDESMDEGDTDTVEVATADTPTEEEQPDTTEDPVVDEGDTSDPEETPTNDTTPEASDTDGTDTSTTSNSTDTGTTSGGSTSGGGTTSGGTVTAPTTTASTPIDPNAEVFKGLNSLLNSGKLKAGDRVFLMDGYHGSISLSGLQFGSAVVIANVPGQVAHADSITIRGSKNIVLQGLKVWPTGPNPGNGPIIRTYGDSSDISFINLDVRSVADSPNYPQWSQATWTNNRRNGFLLEGARTTVARTRLTGLYMGILSLGNSGLLEENIIDGFSGDGMRATGDNSIVRRNKVQNCHQINANHADGFQSFSRGAGGKVGTGTVMNLVVDSNKFFEWTLSTSNPLRCKMQGIGMFDGMFDGAVIRNNIVTSSAYHGISIAGALNSIIVNNTVVDAKGQGDKSPWIRLAAHKDGRSSLNSTIANNVANHVVVPSDPATGNSAVNNVIVTNMNNEFVGFGQLDFRLKSTSRAVDAGNTNLAPNVDIAGTGRPMGKAPDAGAYESH